MTIDSILFGDPHGTGGLLLELKNNFGTGATKTLDIIEIPVLFQRVAGKAEALTPDLVNWAVYGNHLVAPKPFLCRVNEDVDGDGHLDVNEDTNNNDILDSGEDLDGDTRLDFNEDINRDGVLQTTVTTPEEDANNNFILDTKENDGATNPPNDNSNGRLDTYRDIFEVYLQNALPGKTFHFIDDWYTYHIQEGEVHCGTNERRSFPADKWWLK
jgi:hypothetical protein